MSINNSDVQTNHGNGIICLICQSPIQENETQSLCPSCNKPYHDECWTENKGCAVYGCPEVPPTEVLNDLEVPVSYWGEEKKACPSCGKEIIAAALRCSHCGTIFSSARPQSREKFRGEEELKEKKSSLQRQVLTFFVLNIIIFTAPIGALFSIFWYRSNSKDLKSLSHKHQAVTKIGIGAGIAQTVLLIILGFFYSIFG